MRHFLCQKCLTAQVKILQKPEIVANFQLLHQNVHPVFIQNLCPTYRGFSFGFNFLRFTKIKFQNSKNLFSQIFKNPVQVFIQLLSSRFYHFIPTQDHHQLISQIIINGFISPFQETDKGPFLNAKIRLLHQDAFNKQCCSR